ncbi:MAG: hypothetical protein AAF720_07235 [Pseudomonadota bacterium]
MKSQFLAAVSFVVLSSTAVQAEPKLIAALDNHATVVAQSSDEAKIVWPAIPEYDRAEFARKFSIAAAMAAIGLALLRLGGFSLIKRQLNVVAPHVIDGAKTAVRATSQTARFVANKVKSPMRRVGIFASLVFVTMLAAGFYDVEWLSGMAIGAAFAFFSIGSLTKMRRSLASIGMPRRKTAATVAD